MKKEIVTIKYPLRYLEQIILIVLIVYFGINFKMTFSNSTYFFNICYFMCYLVIFYYLYAKK